jgi:very-short-patch-repair endonuclease
MAPTPPKGRESLTEHFNRTTEKAKRRHLRNNATSAEIELWERLKRKQVHGLKFRRQYIMGPYVIDLYCPSCKLAIEVDGDSHYIGNAAGHDAGRQAYIEQFGVTFLRVTNADVYNNLEGVLEAIAAKALSLQTAQVLATDSPLLTKEGPGEVTGEPRSPAQ